MRTLGRSGDLDQVVSRYIENGSQGRVLDLGVTQFGGLEPKLNRRVGVHGKFNEKESGGKLIGWR